MAIDKMSIKVDVTPSNNADSRAILNTVIREVTVRDLEKL